MSKKRLFPLFCEFLTYLIINILGYSTPVLAKPRTMPAPRIWPKLMVAKSSGKPKVFLEANWGTGNPLPFPVFWIANLGFIFADI